MLSVLPQAEQNPRSAYRDDRYRAGSPRTHAKQPAGKCTNAIAGAPECLRHIEQ
jgi:hypothetical protein